MTFKEWQKTKTKIIGGKSLQANGCYLSLFDETFNSGSDVYENGEIKRKPIYVDGYEYALGSISETKNGKYWTLFSNEFIEGTLKLCEQWLWKNYVNDELNN